MLPPDAVAENGIPEQLLQKLSETSLACSSLSSVSDNRTGNYVYRGHLIRPIANPDQRWASSIIIKHSTDSIPKVFEELLLNLLASSPTSTSTVKTPRLYLYDRETNTQVLEDFADTNGLRAMLFSPDAHKLFPSSSLFTIGRHMGLWLRSFHDWADAPEQASLRAEMWCTDALRKQKYEFTHGSISGILEQFPSLTEDYEKTLDVIRGFYATDFKRPFTEEGDGYGLIHGDLWSGNVLLPSSGWREPSVIDQTNNIFIIDWEFAQFGHRSCDIGQLLGDLYERKLYRNLDIAMSVMKGVIVGYGAMSDEMAFRTSIYLGSHLISWYHRRPQKGPNVSSPEVTLAGLKLGRDFMVKGQERDRAFFDDSVLASLFASH
ncbi:hypothetical protein VTL71DRAFT_145 [Oculimacula yallundae]|uniref:Aminoglycoside phosphotransferase domain-containing protein n=1 Tax=Oculimacula yallundae TaxID=86028 RepID=A0ABR4D0Q1_9HELO